MTWFYKSSFYFCFTRIIYICEINEKLILLIVILSNSDVYHFFYANIYSLLEKKNFKSYLLHMWSVSRFKYPIYNLRFRVSPSILSSSPVLKAMKYYFTLYMGHLYYTREYQQQHRLEITVILLLHKWLTALTAFRYSKPAIIISVTGTREDPCFSPSIGWNFRVDDFPLGINCKRMARAQH